MLVMTPYENRYKHQIDQYDLPEYIRSVFKEDASEGDGLIDYLDGDFKYPTSWNELNNYFSDFYKECAEEDDLEPGTLNELELFLDSFPSEYKNTDTQFLVCFYH